MKWVSFVLVLVVAAWVSWYFGVIQEVVKGFEDWLKYIGMA
jgi:hypothetical protein